MRPKTSLYTFLILFCLPHLVQGANYYWIASGPANWSASANWASVSGGSGGAGVPGISDVANFDGNGSGNCTLDIGLNIAGINVNNSFTGTISQTTHAITIGASNAVFAGGTFTGAANNITVAGTFTLSGTTFTSTSGLLTMENTVTCSGGSFNPNNGTAALSVNTYTVTGTFSFYNLVISGNYNTITFANPTTVTNNLTLSAAAGNVTTNVNSLTVQGATSLIGANTIILSSGTINAQGNILTSFTGDPYAVGNGTININGSGNQTMNTTSPAGQGILPNITINKPSGKLTLKGTISFFGNWNYVQGNVDAVTNTTTVCFQEGNSIVNGQGASSFMSFYNFSVNAISGSGGCYLTLGGNLYVSNNLLVNNPGSTATTILDASGNGYTIQTGGNFIGEANTTFYQNNSTVILNGSGLQTVGLGNVTFGSLENVFNNLTINNTGSGIQLLTSNLVVNNLTLTQGLINLNNLTLTLGTAASAPGVLTQTNGWVYGGTFTRWFSQASLVIPSSTGLLPMGWSSDYCPVWVGYGSNLSAGGTISATFTYIPDNAWPFTSFVDPTWNGGTTIVTETNSYWTLSTGNGFTPAGNTINLRHGGGIISFGSNVLADVGSCLAGSVVGTYAAATNNSVATEGNRTGLSGTQLNNTFYLCTTDMSLTGAPLPITLVSFTALASGNEVKLNWETATETNNAFFTLEKSRDGIHFEKLTDVLAASGNSSSTRYYVETDYEPFQGVSYYSLRQTDLNGSTRELAIAAANIKPTQSLDIYPNPLEHSGQLHLGTKGYKNQEILVVLINAAGQECVSRMLLSVNDQGDFTLTETEDLAPGCYIVIATSNNKLYNYKLLIK
jgi:fibronectin-binding autotransporter adhesin